MSHWIVYEDFVEQLRGYHQAGYSGLITGVSDQGHSFQIGYDRGRIVLLNYRIKKGTAALKLITQIERARISEHATSDFSGSDSELPDTSNILTLLTAAQRDDDTDHTDITAVPEMPPSATTSTARSIDRKLREAIESAAIHHFGPIGAIICAEHIEDSSGDVRQIMLLIAQEVGASEADARAFFHSVTSS